MRIKHLKLIQGDFQTNGWAVTFAGTLTCATANPPRSPAPRIFISYLACHATVSLGLASPV